MIHLLQVMFTPRIEKPVSKNMLVLISNPHHKSEIFDDHIRAFFQQHSVRLFQCVTSLACPPYKLFVCELRILRNANLFSVY